MSKCLHDKLKVLEKKKKRFIQKHCQSFAKQKSTFCRGASSIWTIGIDLIFARNKTAVVVSESQILFESLEFLGKKKLFHLKRGIILQSNSCIFLFFIILCTIYFQGIDDYGSPLLPVIIALNNICPLNIISPLLLDPAIFLSSLQYALWVL